MKVSDYIIKRLGEYGIEYIFMVSGGAIMHLTDSLYNSKIKYICFQHEQAAAIAAEGYARASGKLAVVLVTSGPGGLNCLTGVMGQWTDSVPVLYISGQIKRETINDGSLRQLGDQEVDIVSIVKPITKISTTVTEPADIEYYLKAFVFWALSGRQGPVWLNIPIDIQGADIEANN